MEKTTNIRFKLNSIEQEEFTSNIQGFDMAGFDDNQMKFQYKIETLIKMPINAILVKSSVRYQYHERTLLEASIVLNFVFDNLSSAITIDRENRTINTKADIFPTFVSTAYSTLRGIVFARSSGSFLSKYPIPMIDSVTLVQKNGITLDEELHD